jgi:hypothetical protein
MAKRIIKHRLFTWFEEVDSPVQPGTTVLAERIAHFGQEIDITNPAYITRGELPEIDAFYTQTEAKAILDGSYSGPDAALLFSARSGSFAGPKQILPAEGEHGDVSSMDASQVAEIINPPLFGLDGKKLTVTETLALAGEDEDSINKVLDAENIATDNSPRAGVVDALEAKLNAATQS